MLAKFASSLLDAGGKARNDYVANTLYNASYPPNTVIKSDLDYVANYWQVRGFDLWEEVDSGLHFFNLMVQVASPPFPPLGSCHAGADSHWQSNGP